MKKDPSEAHHLEISKNWAQKKQSKAKLPEKNTEDSKSIATSEKRTQN